MDSITELHSGNKESQHPREIQLEVIAKRAADKVDNLAGILREVGVEPDKITAASELAAQRAKEEFQKSERLNPVEILTDVLKSAAKTPQEEWVTTFNLARLEKTRKEWSQAMRVVMRQDTGRRSLVSLMEEANRRRLELKVSRGGMSVSERGDRTFKMPLVDIHYPRSNPQYPDQTDITRPPEDLHVDSYFGDRTPAEYSKRVLESLGVVEEGESLDDLRDRLTTEDNKDDNIRIVPTKFPGISAEFVCSDTSQYHSIDVMLDPRAFKMFVDSPPIRPALTKGVNPDAYWIQAKMVSSIG